MTTPTTSAPMGKTETVLRAALEDIKPALGCLLDFLKSDDGEPEQLHDAARLLRHAAEQVETLGGPLPARVLPPGVIDLGRRRRLRRIGAGGVR
jgi:hypothetical protein